MMEGSRTHHSLGNALQRRTTKFVKFLMTCSINILKKKKKNEEEKEYLVRASNFLSQNEGKVKNFYVIGKAIGSGSFGEVRLCIHKETGS